MRRKLICANWKMNHTLADGISFFENLPVDRLRELDVEKVVFPPFPLIYPLIADADRCGIELGGQNLNENPKGAFTGEVSTDILLSVGAKWVIVGHSERRDIFKETDELIAKKVKAGIGSGLKIILCVGEHLDIRRAKKEIEIVKNQLEIDLSGMTSDDMELVTIAYEPVWAIGTGLAAQPKDAEDMMSFIRDWLDSRFGFDTASKVRILYGGSVTPENIKAFADKQNIDGALVGGASLNPETFAGIVIAVG